MVRWLDVVWIKGGPGGAVAGCGMDKRRPWWCGGLMLFG